MRLLFLIGCLALWTATGADAADNPSETGATAAIPAPAGTTPSSPAPASEPPAEPAPIVQTMPPKATVAILGKAVFDSTNKQIGRLIDVLVDASGEPQAAVLDFGGFMGVGNRTIAVHWAALHFDPEGKRPIRLELTPDEIKAVPEYRGSSKPAPVVTPARIIAPLAETPPHSVAVPDANAPAPSAAQTGTNAPKN